MDTLDKILKTHPTPIHLRLHKNEFELVIVSQYPHGYDVSSRHICDSLQMAFDKAISHVPHFADTPDEWRIYKFGYIPVA